MDKKRIIIIVIFLLVCVVLGYLLYRVFFAKEKLSILPKTTPTTTIKTLPTAQPGGVRTSTTAGPSQLPSSETVYPEENIEVAEISKYPTQTAVDVPISNASTDQNGIPRFYNQIDGKFYKMDRNGNVNVLSDAVFYNVQNVTWSPTTNESVIEYPDGSNIYYNFETKKQVTLPKHWQDFTFSPQGDKIASKSIGLSTENRWLVTSDPTGKNIKLIEPLGDNADKVTVDWSPNQQIIAMSKTGESLGSDRQEILFVGQNKENFKSLIVEGRGFESTWSPTGEKLLYSVYSSRSNHMPELWIVNAVGDSIGTERKLLDVNTWSNKCTFADERTVYCAVPKTMQAGTGFAPTLSDFIPDAIYKIDINTGLKTQISTDEDKTIDNLYIGDNGKKLYFTDKQNNGLYNINL